MTSVIHNLPHIDIQHDTLAVIDDVEQSVVVAEDFWVSAYKLGSTSVHGKVNVSAREGGGSQLVARNGVHVHREGKTTFRTSVPVLGLKDVPVRFAKQEISPPYQKKTTIAPELTVNSLAHSAKRQKLAIAGPDGYLVLVPSKAGASGVSGSEAVVLKGHVGDVLDVKFFPSGEVILSTSSDLSIRIFGLDGSNPRTLTGHTRAVTSTAIRGVGKEVVSGSKDGTVRLWNVGEDKVVRKWFTNPPRAVEAVFLDTATGAGSGSGSESETTKGDIGTERILALRSDGVLQVFDLEPTETGEGTTEITLDLGEGVQSALVSAAWDQERRILATGHSNGVVTLWRLPVDLSTLLPLSGSGSDKDSSNAQFGPYLIRRDESSIYSLHFTPLGDLCIGPASGLACKLAISPPGAGEAGGDWSIKTMEEHAGWNNAGVEAWCDADEEGGVWCAGADKVVRRY